LAVTDAKSAAELVLFLLEGAFISFLAGQMHRARDAAIRGQAEARQLERELLRVSDDERQRIGHDLHDGLGQQLTGVALLSKVLSQRLARQRLPEAKDAAAISDLVTETIAQAKGLARGLAPVAIGQDGLARALQGLAQSAERLFNVTVTCDADDAPLPHDPSVAMHLYRIAQEAVSNAVKHGRATTVAIELHVDDQQTALSVSNDGGVPFTLPPGDASGGMGLRIMRHRANMLGATLDVRPVAGGRTLLTCAVPRPPAEKPTAVPVPPPAGATLGRAADGIA
jgi:signal transduction histidine kinase